MGCGRRFVRDWTESYKYTGGAPHLCDNCLTAGVAPKPYDEDHDRRFVCRALGLDVDGEE